MNVYSRYPKYYELVSIIYQILTMYWRESRVYIIISSLMILLVHSLYLRPLYQLIKSNLILILNYFLLQVCFILWFFLSIRIILMLFNLVRWRKSMLFSKYPLSFWWVLYSPFQKIWMNIYLHYIQNTILTNIMSLILMIIMISTFIWMNLVVLYLEWLIVCPFFS